MTQTRRQFVGNGLAIAAAFSVFRISQTPQRSKRPSLPSPVVLTQLRTGSP